MSDRKEWVDVRQEMQPDGDGKMVPVKVFREFRSHSRTIFGMEAKGFVETFVKLLGIVTVVIAFLKYTGDITKDRKEQAEKAVVERKQDSLQRVSFGLAQEGVLEQIHNDERLREADDSDFRLKQQSFWYSQQRDLRDRAVQQDQFATNFQQQLLEIEKRREGDLLNQVELIRMQTFFTTTTSIAALLRPAVSDGEFGDKITQLQGDLYPRIRLLNDTDVIKKMDAVLGYLTFYRTMNRGKILVDSLSQQALTLQEAFSSYRNTNGRQGEDNDRNVKKRLAEIIRDTSMILRNLALIKTKSRLLTQMQMDSKELHHADATLQANIELFNSCMTTIAAQYDDVQRKLDQYYRVDLTPYMHHLPEPGNFALRNMDRANHNSYLVIVLLDSAQLRASKAIREVYIAGTTMNQQLTSLNQELNREMILSNDKRAKLQKL